MSDFLERFGEDGKFSAARQGTIVGLLCIGTLVGCLTSGWLCDKIGRRYTISSSAFFYIIGVIIEITSSTQWVQFAMGRFTAGLGIGALSTSVPMYQSESVPKNIRGATVSSYQLLITLGIWTAYMVSTTILQVRLPLIYYRSTMVRRLLMKTLHNGESPTDSLHFGQSFWDLRSFSCPSPLDSLTAWVASQRHERPWRVLVALILSLL